VIFIGGARSPEHANECSALRQTVAGDVAAEEIVGVEAELVEHGAGVRARRSDGAAGMGRGAGQSRRRSGHPGLAEAGMVAL
jgi:hypothetical protein